MHSFRVEQTRFERSENRVCVTSLWKGTFGKICVQTAICFEWNERDEVRAKREPSPFKTESGQCTEVPLLDPFLPFFACLHCKEDKIWAMHYSSLTAAWFSAFSRVFTAMKTKSGQCNEEALLRPFPSFFRVSSLQWRQNLVNALKYHYWTLSFLFSRVFTAKKTKSGQCTIVVLLQSGFRLFCVSSLQWRQNLGNAL